MRDPPNGGTAATPPDHDGDEDRIAPLEAEVARLRRSEAHYRAVIESASDFAIFATDLDGRITSWNAGAEALLGWPEAEAVGEDACMIFTPDDRADNACEREMRTAAEQGRAEDERWHVRKDGSRFWASGLLMCLEEEGVGHLGYLKILRDRTSQHEANEAGRLAAAKLEALASERVATLDQLAEGVVVTDADGRITFVNRAAAELHGSTGSTSRRRSTPPPTTCSLRRARPIQRSTSRWRVPCAARPSSMHAGAFGGRTGRRFWRSAAPARCAVSTAPRPAPS
jgi:PAS domain S-box-containing protein